MYKEDLTPYTYRCKHRTVQQDLQQDQSCGGALLANKLDQYFECLCACV